MIETKQDNMKQKGFNLNESAEIESPNAELSNGIEEANGLPIESFEYESLKWPGFVEFDDVNGKVLTYSAQDRQKDCDLLKLVAINATDLGLTSLAEDCSDLEELELHKCTDNLLRGISACVNLRALRLVGSVDGLYSSSVSDIGLTFLAQGCKRLVKLELSGCEGSFDGIKAIGQCCEVLDELTIVDHRMDRESSRN